jgi:hypothetical protein
LNTCGHILHETSSLTRRWHGPHRKHRFYYCVFSRWQGKTCPKSCSLSTAVILSLVYTAVTWQWVYMSQHAVMNDVNFIVKVARKVIKSGKV